MGTGRLNYWTPLCENLRAAFSRLNWGNKSIEFAFWGCFWSYRLHHFPLEWKPVVAALSPRKKASTCKQSSIMPKEKRKKKRNLQAFLFALRVKKKNCKILCKIYQILYFFSSFFSLIFTPFKLDLYISPYYICIFIYNITTLLLSWIQFSSKF